MEIQVILRLLLKKWWVIALTIGVVVASTYLFTVRQPRVYSATVTYIVSPSPELLNGSSFVNGLSVLGGQSTITNTYANIATSARIRESAVKSLGINQEQNLDLAVSSRVRSGTNMIEITVEGTNPQLVQQFANQIGSSTVTFVNQLYEVYDMNILDAAVLPVDPIRPNLLINLALSAIIAGGLGMGLALVLAKVERPAARPAAVGADVEYPAGKEALEQI